MSAVEEMLGKALEAGQVMGKVIGKTEGRAEGKAEMQDNVALALIKLGKNALEDIAKVCHLSLDRVNELAATVNP